MLTQLTQTNQSFVPTSLLKHMTSGEIKKGKSFGIHFFNTSRHRVVQLLRPPNEKGIWEAKIEILNPKTNAWVLKKKASTFFPVTWCPATLLLKLEEAYRNSIPVRSYKMRGTTSCGVGIIFIVQGMEVTTCFPEY